MRKSLKHWKQQLKHLNQTLNKTKEDDSFLFEMLAQKRDEAQAIIFSLERQLGVKNEKKSKNN